MLSVKTGITTLSGSAPPGTPKRLAVSARAQGQISFTSPDGVIIAVASISVSLADARLTPIVNAGDSCSSEGFVTSNRTS